MKARAGSDIGLQKPINAIFGSTPSTKQATTTNPKRKHVSDTDSASKAVRSEVQGDILKKMGVIKSVVNTPSNKEPTIIVVSEEAEEATLSPDLNEKKIDDVPISHFELDPKTPDTKVKFKDIDEEDEEITTKVETDSKYIGKSIRKYFDGHGWFIGKVTSIVEENHDLWKVTYQDGDSEELSEGDLLVYINEFDKEMNSSNQQTKDTIANIATSIAVTTPTIKATAAATDTKKKVRSTAWCADGWKIEDRKNPPDAKSKPGEVVRHWVAPDGTAFKTLKAAKKRAAADSEKTSVEKTESVKTDTVSKPVSSSFFGNVKPKTDKTTSEMMDTGNDVSDSSMKIDTAITTTTAAGVEETKEKEEWVQCDSCSKWRKLALGMSVSSLGDTWSCSLNTWDLQRSNCEASQEATDEEIDGKKCKKKQGKSAAAAAAASAKTQKKAPVEKKPLCPEAQALLLKYRKELDQVALDYDSIMKLDAFTRAQQLKELDVSSNKEESMEESNVGEMSSLPADIEVVKQGVPWALEEMLSEAVNDPVDDVIKDVSTGEPVSTESTNKEAATTVTTDATTTTATATMMMIPNGLTSASFPVSFQKLVACFIQGSSAPLPLLIQQLKTFCDLQASKDQMESNELMSSTSLKEVDDDAIMKDDVSNIEKETEASEENDQKKKEKKSNQLLHRAALLSNITFEELSNKIPLIAERKCYGTSLRGNQLLLLNEIDSSLIHAKWEVINLDLISYHNSTDKSTDKSSGDSAKKLIEISKKERRRYGNFIKAWSRIVEVIEKQTKFDMKKIEIEISKLNKLELEEKARLLKQAQLDAIKLEQKKALERKKLEKLNKLNELNEKEKEKQILNELKLKEKELLNQEKLKLELELEEKKKKQSMKFMGFFKSSTSNTTPLTSMKPLSVTASINNTDKSDKTSLNKDNNNASSSSSSSIFANNNKVVLNGGTSSLSSTSHLGNNGNGGGGTSSLSSLSNISTNQNQDPSFKILENYKSSIGYQNMVERLRNFNKEEHDQMISNNMDSHELNLKFVEKAKQSKKLKSTKQKNLNLNNNKKKQRWITAKVSVVTEVNNEGAVWGEQTSFVELKDKYFKNKLQFLQFQEDERPAYFGTWSKISTLINGRRPFVKDHSKLRHYGEITSSSSSSLSSSNNNNNGYQLNYEVDSEAEWEEEEAGEDLDDKEGDNEEEEVDDLDYADGWLRKDDDLGSDDEGEEGARYTHNGDEQPNPPSVEGPFILSGNQDLRSEPLPEHLNKYRVIPMPWVVSTKTTTKTITTTTMVDGGAGSTIDGQMVLLPNNENIVENEMGCFPMRIVDSLRDSLAIYDIVQPKPPKAPKQLKTSTSTTTTTTTGATTTATTVVPEPTAESAAAAFAAAASMVASLQAPPPTTNDLTGQGSNSSTSEPPMKKPKAELKMVTNLEHLAFLAGLIHQSDGWTSDKIISTFITKYPEHSKSSTKRTLNDIATHSSLVKGRMKSWLLKPESLAKFGIEAHQSETSSAMKSSPVITDTLQVATTTHNETTSTATADKTKDIQTPQGLKLSTALKSSSPKDEKKMMKSKSPVVKRKEITIIDMFAKKTSPMKKQKTETSAPAAAPEAVAPEAVAPVAVAPVAVAPVAVAPEVEVVEVTTAVMTEPNKEEEAEAVKIQSEITDVQITDNAMSEN